MGLGSGILDPEKNLFQIPDPGSGSSVKKAQDPGSWIRIGNTVFNELVCNIISVQEL
jgi:hypothetical protein